MTSTDLSTTPPRQPGDHQPRCIDIDAAERAARQLLHALGIDLDNEALRKTPRRMATAYAEFFTPRPFELTTFPNDDAYDELVVARGIPMQSVCEHHLLPFHGTAVVGYLPGTRILGISKLARVVEHFASRLQVQERLTQQVASWLTQHLQPKGVGVLIAAQHACMNLRGARARDATTITSAMHGTLRTDARSRQEFLALARGPS